MSAEAPTEKNKQIYEEEREDLWRRQLSASENLDKTIIFTSLPIFGISLVFFKDIAPTGVIYVEVLILSWVSFVGAILCVISSYWTCILAANKMDPQLADYYLREGEKTPYSMHNTATKILNYFSTGFYVIAVISIVIFFILNLQREENVLCHDHEKNRHKTLHVVQKGSTKDLQCAQFEKGKGMTNLNHQSKINLRMNLPNSHIQH